jgi:hypothetical protein
MGSGTGERKVKNANEAVSPADKSINMESVKLGKTQKSRSNRVVGWQAWFGSKK